MSASGGRLSQEIAELARALPEVTIARLAAIFEEAPAPSRALEEALLEAVVQPGSKHRVLGLLATWRQVTPLVPPVAVAWALRAAGACETSHYANECIDLVWTGPLTLSQGIYQTHQTLLDVIGKASRSLLVVTFAAYKIDSVWKALHAATERGVHVSIVVETDEGPGGKIDVSPLRELAMEWSHLSIYEWPVDLRPRHGERYGALHAKCALADDDVLFVSSANLTGNALQLNMELGVLIRGGAAPIRAGRHFGEMIERGILRRINL